MWNKFQRSIPCEGNRDDSKIFLVRCQMNLPELRMSRDGVYGGLWHELSNQPIMEMSPSVT